MGFDGVHDPGEINTSVWARGRFVRSYAGRSLRPVESLLLGRYAADLRGRTLELGCGAGRISGHLAQLATEFHGVDVSDRMIGVCRARYPGVSFIQGDMRDLSRFADDSVDAVVAGWNVLDILADSDRRLMLREIRRVLRPDGLLLMSSHNREALGRVRGPWAVRTDRPLSLAKDLLRVPLRVARHRRLRKLEREEPGYAIVSDGSHDFSLVHYYVGMAAQLRQFEQEGFTPLACLDLDGAEHDPRRPGGDSELHYVARRAPVSSGGRGRPAGAAALSARGDERLVDLDEGLPLAPGEPRVFADCLHDL